ncbi:arginyltransferase [Pelagibacterium luteolum]|uniref:Aspartate/glutamate leucyltransferase n=1 Tax=Pelagibacterium luteolum TaxID=440168 RepID=A0A1G7WG43_9HYPH|nr:arginyltransferase [Pelagibacterium luteolum]SDG71005.1 arginine-tRNA-protein transferase [Pelagibacterium luteolum]
MDHTPESAQFFLTAPSPCPYLPGQQERKLFTHLSGRRASALHHLLSDHGFRRSQNLIYRPACLDCDACQSVRVNAKAFTPATRHRRNLRINADIASEVVAPMVTSEQYGLFKRYLDARHDGGGMTQMSYLDYEFMVEDTPVRSVLIEYRMRADADGLAEGQLVGVALTDPLPDGLSMVYSFFDPALRRRGLGTMMILDHIARAAEMGGYLYLGYWVKDSPKMAYKVGFQPLEVQKGARGWVELDPDLPPDAE